MSGGAGLGTATLMPSNLVTPSSRLLSDPRWVPTESAVPEQSVYVEDVHDRIMIVVGQPTMTGLDLRAGGAAGGDQTFFLSDNTNGESSVSFVFNNLSIQQCTGFELEEVILQLPPSTTPRRGVLVNDLCGDLIDDDLNTPRRMVWSVADGQIPIIVAGRLHSFDLYNFLPYGNSIEYYRPADILQYLLNAWTNFMVNRLGDSSFSATLYASSIGELRIFFTSTTYGFNSIRFMLASNAEELSRSALNILLKLFYFGGARRDTYLGVDGESFSVNPRQDTGFQNNAPFITLHSNELTQFRKNDSVAPTEGTSLFGVITPAEGEQDLKNGQMIVYKVTKGTLLSPKMAFDRNQVLTQFEVVLRTSKDSLQFDYLTFKPTDVNQIALTLIFRMW